MKMPANDPIVAGLVKRLNDLEQEVRELRRTPNEAPQMALKTEKVVYSHPGSPSLTKSPPHLVRQPQASVTSVSAALEVAGTTATEVRLLRLRRVGAGIQTRTIANLTLPSGDFYDAVDDLMMDVEEMDRLVVETVTAGTGASNIAVTVIISESVE